MIRTLEELSLNALPALQTVLHDGWVLRFAAGYTRRANSVQPLYTPAGSLAGQVHACEALYAAQGRPAFFKLTPAAQPADLDEFLAARGYTVDAPTSLQTVRLAAPLPADPAGLEITPAPSERWQAAFHALAAVPSQHRPTLARMLANLIPAAGFALITADGQPVACGLGVLQSGYLGLFDIATAPAARRRGLGRRLVSGLLNWGLAAGAHTAYLQVMRANAPALSLYAGLGFTEAYAYWYRIPPKV